MRIVFDTNVLVSGIYWSGYPFEILQAIDEKIFQMVMSEEIFTEYIRVIRVLQNKCKSTVNTDKILEHIKLKSHWNIPTVLPH